MLEVSHVLKCKQLHAQGASIRAIARDLDISRNTVRRYVRGERQPGEYRQSGQRCQPARDKIRSEVEALLKAEQTAKTPRKQRLTAARVHRLLERQGLTVSAVTVRRLVATVKLSLRDALAQAYLPLAYDPGQDGQVDFFEGVVQDESGVQTKVFILLVRACFSGRTFVYAAPNQTREALLEGLTQAFEHFGGVFRRLWFDNLTPAVRKVLRGRDRVQQRGFEVFVAHYGFEAVFCAPGAGWEKGGVEGAVKYSRHEILSPIPIVTGRPGLQLLCDAFMERELARRPVHREQTIGELWEHEVSELMPMPRGRFDASRARETKVTKSSWVCSGTNFYSVPVAWVGHQVLLKLDAERVLIIGPQGETTRHERCHGRHQMRLQLSHYLPLLRRKSRGLDLAVPVRQWLVEQAACWSELLRRLRRHQGEVPGSKAFVDVLALCEQHDIASVEAAIAVALSHPEVSRETVRYQLRRQRAADSPPPAQVVFAGPSIEQGSAASYGSLVHGNPVAKEVLGV
ncbi:MAG: IS21 family transposase [Planctomycetota bacterium]|nr:MAG: IS21 family transposase [Planctomycetota bacterium]